MVAACAHRHDKSTGQTQGKGNKQQIAQPHNANEDTRQQIAHNAADAAGVATRAALAAVFFQLIRLLGAAYWTQHGSFTFEDQVELVRGFSAEIEYSDENLYALLGML